MYIRFCLRHFLITLVIFSILTFITTTTIDASCTYKSRFLNSHADVIVSNDTNSVSNINIYISGAKITKWYAPSQEGWVWNVSGFSIGNNGWDVGTGDHTKQPYIVMWRDDTAILFSSPVNGTTSQLLYKLPEGIYGIDLTNNIDHIDEVSQVGIGEINNYNCSYAGTITNHDVSKLILVPGLGASWNAEALMNCGESNTPWVLAPYAEDVYNPAINATKANGWDTLPFYYDWRKNIEVNSLKLSNFIDDETVDYEKVNLVGHSMGGLVARGYLANSQGENIANLLTIGTPNKGSALAYPPWAWGQVWPNNFIEKIALTLYLEHCGGLFSNPSDVIKEKFPSVKDLIPTYPYYRKIPSTELSTPVMNTWLNTLNNSVNNYGVRLGYIAGTGFDTLKIIQVKDSSKGDLKKDITATEKPVGKVSITEGDGTVLLESAILPGATYSAVINENHRGLVSSTQGIAKILEFFGRPNQSPTVQYTNNGSPNSALILIGYPASFSVFDENGNVKNDKQGMVAIMNPKTGNYKVNLISKSNGTKIIVAQFLPNGDIKYKEYSLKGIGPKSKMLKFDLENPQEDILTD